MQLISGTLESVNEAAVFDGANLCAVETNDGAWELLQFRTADLIGDRRYQLSSLLRGQLGSDALMPAAHDPGARFVMLDARLNRLDLTSADMNRAFTWRFGPDGRAFGGPSFHEQTHAYRGVGRRPYAPVHVRGQRTDDGVLISWTRRSRIDADNWEQPEVPLGEISETYQVEIFDGASVVRTLTTGQSQTLYVTADIDADFATTPDTIAVAVHQMSDVFGRGLPAHGNV